MDKVYSITAYDSHRRPLAAVSVKAEGKFDALTKAKEQGAFPIGTRRYVIQKAPVVVPDMPALTLEFCAMEILRQGYIRVGLSSLTHCFDNSVSVTDWHGNTVWFDRLTIEAVQHFIDIQPK